jgi:hypothetical protein
MRVVYVATRAQFRFRELKMASNSQLVESSGEVIYMYITNRKWNLSEILFS